MNESSPTRTEHDTLGPVQVPQDAMWGAQTERARRNFDIGQERLPRAMIRALGLVKAACARANAALGALDMPRAGAITEAALEVAEGRWDDHFPLVVWQSGSGTQSHMNANEVIARRAEQILGDGTSVHPNDHVNQSQSTNDVFPSATHVAAIEQVSTRLLPALDALSQALAQKSDAFGDIVKVGRTHLMDAAPLTLGQEFSGYVAQLGYARRAILQAIELVLELPLGGTAVGTGLNAPAGFDRLACRELAVMTGHGYKSAPNKFALLAGKEALVELHGALRTLAQALHKIAGDVRWMASGPRAGLGELVMPANEPGSSIMPGKVNPTQAEALSMVAVQVMGLDAAVGFAAALGHFELNTYKPLFMYNVLQSTALLAGAMHAFEVRAVRGLVAQRAHIARLAGENLMLATALNPVLGYERAAHVAQKALAEHLGVREAALALGYLTGEAFDAAVNLDRMVGRAPGERSEEGPDAAGQTTGAGQTSGTGEQEPPGWPRQSGADEGLPEG